jgi:hypothetical protein
MRRPFMTWLNNQSHNESWMKICRWWIETRLESNRVFRFNRHCQMKKTTTSSIAVSLCQPFKFGGMRNQAVLSETYSHPVSCGGRHNNRERAIIDKCFFLRAVQSRMDSSNILQLEAEEYFCLDHTTPHRKHHHPSTRKHYCSSAWIYISRRGCVWRHSSLPIASNPDERGIVWENVFEWSCGTSMGVDHGPQGRIHVEKTTTFWPLFRSTRSMMRHSGSYERHLLPWL